MPTVKLDFLSGLRDTHSPLSQLLRLAPVRADSEYAVAEVLRLLAYLPALGAAGVSDSSHCTPTESNSSNRDSADPTSTSSVRADVLALSAFIRTHLNHRQRSAVLEYLATLPVEASPSVEATASAESAQAAVHSPGANTHHRDFRRQLQPVLDALEPAPRGPRRFESVSLPADDNRSDRTPRDLISNHRVSNATMPQVQPLTVRQGRLGDCWLIAVLHACEVTNPGFTASLLQPLAPGFVRVHLHRPFGAPVVVSTRVPRAHRAGGQRLEANAASLVEKAVAVTFGRGRYSWIQNNFAGTALSLLAGRWCPARPLPGIAQVRQWLAAGRPVLASTLIRRRGAFLLPREDDPTRSVALMSGHVYVVVGVKPVDEDGRASPGGTLRVHVRNPLLERETEPRRTDLFLSEAQFRKAFISVNAGPVLRKPA